MNIEDDWPSRCPKYYIEYSVLYTNVLWLDVLNTRIGIFGGTLDVKPTYLLTAPNSFYKN